MIRKPFPRKQSHSIRCLCTLMALCVCFVLLSGCAPRADAQRITFVSDEYAPYAEVMMPLLPGYAFAHAQGIGFFHLEGGTAAEVWDAQAVSVQHSGVATHWYPQYLTTIIIAVDRDRTDAVIQGWRDLPAAQEPVSILSSGANEQMVLAAMSYGLEGEGYTLTSALRLLATIRESGNLLRNSFEPAILICHDYQAAAMKKSGRNIDIIVPSEGTFTYEKGLLSKEPLNFAADPAEALLAAGLRLCDGRCDEALYPPAEAYAQATRVSDFEHLSAVGQDVTREFRRDVLLARVYSSADAREHQLFVLLYIILVVLWTAAVVHRAVQAGVRRAALCTSGILLLWITVRMLKYQLPVANTPDRYLWYAYYLFQLALPLALLWLAWMVDRPEGTESFPPWLRRVAAVSGTLFLLVFANDLHGLVFRLDPSNPRWSSEYSYGIAFYFVMAGYLLPLLGAIGMLLAKGRRNPRKRAFLLPLAFCALLLLYGYGYVTRVPLAWESDYTMVVGLFTLLFMEAALRTGMIPVNTKYALLFQHSPLRMQLINNDGAPALASAGVLRHEDALLREALANSPAPAQQDADTLLFASPVAGGHALWLEDIAALNRLHADIAESVRRLTAANELLARQQTIQQALDASAAKTQLMAQLEGEIAAYIARLKDMAGGLPTAPDPKKETARIALLLCYIKRRCNLFFREKEAERLPAEELAVYLDELGELSALTGTQVHVSSLCGAALPVRCATLLYDFAYDVIDWAATNRCAALLAHMLEENEAVTLRLLPSADARAYRMNHALCAAASLAGGVLAARDLDDATGLSLTLPRGGDGDA